MARIAVLDVAEAEPQFGPFGTTTDMVADWLGPHLDGVSFVGFDVWAGAALPDVAAFDGFILPGSEAGVYDAMPWMAPLRECLLEIRAAGKPVFGICFGHQMMAHSYGGRAEKAEKGFCLGTRVFEGPQADTLAAHVSHQDQVVALPPGARVLARADYCSIAALAYDFPAMSTQFHPEYGPGIIRAIADTLEGKLLNAEEARAARASLNAGGVSPDLFAQETAAFFRRHL